MVKKTAVMNKSWNIALIFSLVAVLMLWIFPQPEPTIPWKTDEKPKSWWEKALEDHLEKFPDDDELREYLQADSN